MRKTADGYCPARGIQSLQSCSVRGGGTLGANGRQRAGHKVEKTGDLREVLTPHLLVGEHGGNQVGVDIIRMGGVEIEDKGVIPCNVSRAVGTMQVQAIVLATLQAGGVKRDQGRQAGSQARGQLVLLLNVVQQRGQVAGANFTQTAEPDFPAPLLDFSVP